MKPYTILLAIAGLAVLEYFEAPIRTSLMTLGYFLLDGVKAA